MRRIYVILRLVPSLILGFFGMAQAADRLPGVSVLADTALTVPLSQLAGSFTRQSHVSVTLSFSPSFEQAQALEDGEAVDVLISAKPGLLKSLQQQGLYDIYTVTPLARSRLSLVSTDSKAVAGDGDITRNRLRALRRQDDFLLASANPAISSEGFYADMLIKRLPRDLSMVGRTVQLQDAEDVMSFLSATPAYGVVFEPEAMQQPHLRQIGRFPESWHDPAIFTGVAIAGGHMDTARNFLSYLQTPGAQRVFARYGFLPPSLPKAN